MLEQAAVQMCARKISAVAGDARAAIDVCRRAVESVETDSRHQLLLQPTVCKWLSVDLCTDYLGM